jgi:hypothetical protein
VLISAIRRDERLIASIASPPARLHAASSPG